MFSGMGPASMATRRSRQRRPPGPAARIGREVGLAMMALGVVVIAFVAYQLFGTALVEQSAQSSLAKQFDAALAHSRAPAGSSRPHDSHAGSSQRPSGSGTSPPTTHHGSASGDTVSAATGHDPAPLSPSVPPGTALDHLVIPSIAVDKFVVQGTAEADLMKGPGHYVGTPMPGQLGNVGIAGHRTTYGAPFFRLGQLQPGDWIYITDAAGRTFDYRVVRKEVVLPADVAVLDAAPIAELTLTTCNPVFSATSRLVVVADLVGQPLAATTPARTATPSALSGSARVPGGGLNLGRGNSGAWPPSIAYGAAAAALWAVARIVAARRRRWRKVGVLAAGAAACALPLWFCFENVVRLLPPNL